jgi:hypothetical protein
MTEDWEALVGAVTVCESPKKRPSQKAIDFEHIIIACAGALIGRGEKMSDADYDRLMLAMDRVQDYL